MFKPVPSEEVYRKLLHFLVVVLPLGVFYGPSLFGQDRSLIAAVTLLLLFLSLIIELVRLRNQVFGTWFYKCFGSMLREDEKLHLTGGTYVSGATFLCAWLSCYNEKLAACSCLALTLFILGDAVAALAGKSFGRFRVGDKTLEGAFACFILCTLLACFIFPLLPAFLEKWGGEITFFEGTIIGLSVAVLELFPIRIGWLILNDNLYVPVLVTFIAYFLR